MHVHTLTHKHKHTHTEEGHERMCTLSLINTHTHTHTHMEEGLLSILYLDNVYGGKTIPTDVIEKHSASLLRFTVYLEPLRKHFKLSVLG